MQMEQVVPQFMVAPLLTMKISYQNTKVLEFYLWQILEKTQMGASFSLPVLNVTFWTKNM